jgi:O-antigen chain-terminating methyltransferase
MNNENFYRAFEDRYRGSRELIKSRLEVYLPFLDALKNASFRTCIGLDIGCGRGEWIELLTENGFKMRGIDLDQGMLSACQERGFDVFFGDGIEHLSKLSSDSLDIISAFHVVEHVTFDQLQKLISESLRVLRPGGLLILETPNPENLVVASANFYLDPTHIKPIPPSLLSFVTEFTGFKRNKVVRLRNL